MKKLCLLYLIVLFIYSPIIFAQGVLIITQYYEGSSNNKWIELTNVGNTEINLESPQLYVALFSNAGADDPANSIPNNSTALGGTLAAGSIILLQHSSAVLPTYASGTSATVCNFNGDDLLIITTTNSPTTGVDWANRLDVIGDGSDWGMNTSFSRKVTNINPSTTFTNSDWDQFTNAQVDGASTGTNERLFEFTGYTPLPIELSSFSASIINNCVRLMWRTETEVNNYGFYVLRKVYPQEESSQHIGWSSIGFVEGYGNTNSTKEYSYMDNKITSGKYAYRLKQIDNDGTFEYSEIIEIYVDIPLEFDLS